MKRLYLALAVLALAFSSSFSSAQETISDVLADPALDLNRPADRALAVERIRAIENTRKQEALAMAQTKGWPTRGVTPENRTFELMRLDDEGNPMYAITHNREAAISTAANLVRNTAPYDLSGNGINVGVWDGGWVRQDHQEFTSPSRVLHLGASATNDTHATHVAGTIGAKGAQTSAQGMAPAAMIHSYNWNDVIAEMRAAAAKEAGQTEKLPISNHSWGFVAGWANGNWSGTSGRHWWGGTNREDPDYGRYTADARNWDSVAYDFPYFLIVHSAGNDRNSNAPSAGTTYYYRSGNSWVSKEYDPATDPYNVGWKDGGFNTISHFSNSKNLMVVGAVTDAVDGSGNRDVNQASMSAFSGWGPTDDGRIKPDVVANGVGLYSPTAGTTTSYGTFSGTSMSSPNVAGSAALLMDQYRKLFPGEDMLASTLKGLIIHTADDMGRPGPDYTFGWGLMNTKEAADLIRDHHANPSTNRMIEAQLTTSIPSKSYSFAWDGASPIRATLCWTDPPGSSTTAMNSTISRLVNDLDLKIIAPDGTQHHPYVMPFVGTWTIESMSENATTGVNSTDNVNQVFIEHPEQSGTWEVVITHKGSLTNNQQHYSLVLSGLSAAPLEMEVSRGGSSIDVNGVDSISGTSATSPTELTYTIANIGGGELELTTPITIGNQSNCTTTVQTQPSNIVTAGNSTDLVLSVAPATTGTWSFTVSIANNDPDKDPYHWIVTGIAGSTATVSFEPVADTYINNQATGTNYGTETIIHLNNQTSGGPPHNRAVVRGLLRFDLSSIPTDATIKTATLDFVQDNNNSGQVNIVEATANWGETTATWSNSNGIYGSTSFGSVNTGTTAGAAIPTISLNSSGLSKVQSWVNDPGGNHGFGITTTNNGSGQSSWLALRSREHSTKAHRPRLTITYESGSEDLPLMVVSGADGLITNGGSDDVADTETGTGIQLTYAINNVGSADLTLITPVDISATSNCSVTVDTQPASPVAASDSTNLILTVTPTASGSWSATVSIENNDPDKNPYTWTISGTALGSHTVTYHGNNNDGGNPPVDPNSPYLEGSSVTVLGPGNLAKTGHTFDSWNTSADGSGTSYAPDASFTLYANTTLHAQWSANTYTVTFDANGGDEPSPAEMEVTFDDAYGPLASTSRAGYTFDGWFTKADGGTEVTEATTVSTANDHMLHAQWTINTYTVSYNGNGNTDGSAPDDQTKTHDVDLTLVGNSGDLTKTGYSFDGWNTDADGSGTDYAPDSLYTENASLTLYAKWNPSADGTWVQTTAGPFDWGTADNWSDGIIATGANRSAFFTPDITAHQVVNLEADRTIGNITFTDSTNPSHNLTITGENILTLSSRMDIPLIDVTQPNHSLTIASQIAGNDGFTKIGAGTLLLTGTNTYTGATTVSEGQLVIDGDQSAATGDVSIADGATLGGTGTLGGNITVEANGELEFNISTPAETHDKLDLASDRTLTFSGASVLTITSSDDPTPGTYTLLTAPGGITGSAPTTLALPEEWVATAEISENNLLLHVTAIEPQGPGPVASFEITGVPSQVKVGTLITGITLTALDANNEIAISFDDTVTFGGTADITGTSVNFIDGQLFDVSITPELVGDDLTFTVDDGEGSTGSVTFDVISLFDSWADTYDLSGEDAEPDATPLGDGISNLLKFAFGMNPTVPSSGVVRVENGQLIATGIPTIYREAGATNADGFHAIFARRKDHESAGLQYSVQFSANLVDDWVTSSTQPTVISEPDAENDIEAVSIPFPTEIQTNEGLKTPRFFRVIVSME